MPGSDDGAWLTPFGADYGSASNSGCRQRERSSSSLRGLPDLSHRLIEAGIYGEYQAFRNRYMQWRRGEPKGAAGELTVTALQGCNDPNAFEYWYPSPSIFKWRYTMAYWKSIFYIVGSFLFTFNAAVCYFDPRGGGGLTRVAPNLIGSVMFSFATYIGYLHMINIATPEQERIVYLVPDCAGMRARSVQVSSIIGTVAFLIGALLFNVGSVAEVFDGGLAPLPRLLFISLANVSASFLFVVGGVCELVHNNIFFSGPTWREKVWWAAILDTIGGCNFLAASLPGALFLETGGSDFEKFSSLNYLLGSACFVVSSSVLLMLWQENNFGMTLLKQLNLAVRNFGYVALSSSSSCGDHVGIRVPMGSSPRSDGGEAAVSATTQDTQVSLRDAFYIIAYCWFAFVAIANCLFREQRFHEHSQAVVWMDMMMDMCMQVFVVVVISLVLVIHSVVTEVPDQQPYYCAVVSTRSILMVGAIVQTFWFVKFWLTPPYKIVSLS